MTIFSHTPNTSPEVTGTRNPNLIVFLHKAFR